MENAYTEEGVLVDSGIQWIEQQSTREAITVRWKKDGHRRKVNYRLRDGSFPSALLGLRFRYQLPGLRTGFWYRKRSAGKTPGRR